MVDLTTAQWSRPHPHDPSQCQGGEHGGRSMGQRQPIWLPPREDSLTLFRREGDWTAGGPCTLRASLKGVGHSQTGRRCVWLLCDDLGPRPRQKESAQVGGGLRVPLNLHPHSSGAMAGPQPEVKPWSSRPPPGHMRKTRGPDTLLQSPPRVLSNQTGLEFRTLSNL